MQYGICGNVDIAGMAAQAGFDYFEMTVGALLKPVPPEVSVMPPTTSEETRAVAPVPVPGAVSLMVAVGTVV